MSYSKKLDWSQCQQASTVWSCKLMPPLFISWEAWVWQHYCSCWSAPGKHLPLLWNYHVSPKYCWKRSVTWRRKLKSTQKPRPQPWINLESLFYAYGSVQVLKLMRHSQKNGPLTGLLWSMWSQQRATDFPQKPLAWGMFLHRLCHLQSHQSCWCLCRCSALGPQGQPLTKEWEREEKGKSLNCRRKKGSAV